MADIARLDVEITANAGKAIQAIDSMSASADRLRRAAEGASAGERDLASGAKDAGTETQKAGTAAGNAERNVRRFGKSAEESGKSAKRGAHGLSTFWRNLTRIAYYRFIRSIIKDLGQSFRDLYGWSNLFGTQFAKSMDTITTSTTYLRNSLVAAVAPLIDLFAPALDLIIDQVVQLINVFNQLFAAISGADTYTVAKKVAREWSDTFTSTSNKAKKTAKDVKATILGFDEINKLTKPTTSSSGSTGSSPYSNNYQTMFEEKPLEGIFKKISDITSGWPDWLKWLLGIGGAVGAWWGIKQLPKLLSNLWDWIKKLFSVKIPDWFRWLFGPKGDGDGSNGIEIPDEITLPDADVDVNLKKGDWSVLNSLTTRPITVPTKLGKSGWTTLSAFIGIFSPLIYVRLGKAGWTSLSTFVGTYSPMVYVRLGKSGWTSLADFVGFYSPIVYVRLGKTAWTSLSAFVGTYSPLVYVRLGKSGWKTLAKYVGTYSTTVFVRLAKEGWSTLDRFVGTYSPLVYVRLGKASWTSLSAFVGTYSPIVYVRLGKSAWTTLANFIGTYSPMVYVRLVRDGWYSLRDFVGSAWVDVGVFLYKGNFSSVSNWLGHWAEVAVYLVRGNFYSLQDWVGYSVTVRVNLQMANGGAITVNKKSGSKGATGGGGKTSGGGVGRGRKALGGIFSNGAWHDIPQYAGGTTSAHGSLFLAGEAGPEIVGHVGGRTEVLNKSQLAAAMYSAVHSAMNGVSLETNFGNVSGSNSEFSAYAAKEHEDMRTQNELLRQQNDLLRMLYEKDNEWSTTGLAKAQAYTNRRAGTTVVPVGT